MILVPVWIIQKTTITGFIQDNWVLASYRFRSLGTVMPISLARDECTFRNCRHSITMDVILNYLRFHLLDWLALHLVSIPATILLSLV